MDLTVAAVPFYFGSMGAEHLWLKAHADQRGPTAGDYEWRDTLASLSMGVGSLFAPMVAQKLLKDITPGKGRWGKVLVVGAIGAAAATTIADVVARRAEAGEVEPDDGATGAPTGGDTAAAEPDRERRRKIARIARRVASSGAVAAVAAGGVAITSTIISKSAGDKLFEKRVLPDLGNGPLALAVAVAGWDFIYYWNHRFMHTSRYMWAIHVVHHSSEHYNLSTALRQTVGDSLGTFIPQTLLCLLGIRPEVVQTARGINLIYQFWIHTEAIDRIGPLESVLNTASHHRVHHGSNRKYLDRNHGSILITWDKLFGTFEPEDPAEPVVYGLTKNIDTFNPMIIATHEHTAMLRDVARSRTWRDRLSFVLRGPGWSMRRHAELAGDAEPVPTAA